MTRHPQTGRSECVSPAGSLHQPVATRHGGLPLTGKTVNGLAHRSARNGPHPSLLLAELVAQGIAKASGQSKLERKQRVLDLMLEGLRDG